MTNYGIDRSDLGKLIPEIYLDFKNAEGPFKEEYIPEHQVRDGFSNDSEATLFLTLIASIDKRKETMSEDGSWKAGKQLWKNENWIYQPKKLIKEYEYSYLIDLFAETETFNYYEDPHIWYLNSLTFYRYYDSDPINLLEEANYDAIEVLKIVRNKKYKQFLSLDDNKVGALWMHLLHEEIHPLSNIEKLDIPVDSHIQGITNKLLQKDFSESEVRNFWNEICRDNNLIPVSIYQPLWILDKYEQEWGKKYLQEKITSL